MPLKVTPMSLPSRADAGRRQSVGGLGQIEMLRRAGETPLAAVWRLTFIARCFERLGPLETPA